MPILRVLQDGAGFELSMPSYDKPLINTVDSIIQGGAGYRVLTPSDVELLLRDVEHTLNCFLPVALILFFMLWAIDLIAIISNDPERYLSGVRQLFNTLKAFIYIKLKKKEGKTD